MSDTNGNTGGGVNGDSGGWQPTPQGEFDADATAFVQMPEGFGLSDFEEGGPGGTPLAAPGGYAPPHISVTGGAATDPAATSAFIVPGMGAAPEQPAAPDRVRWPEPNAPQPATAETTPPGATGHWSFTDPAAGQSPYDVDAQHGQLPTGYESAPPAGYTSGYVPQDPAGYDGGQGFDGYAGQAVGGYTGYAGHEGAEQPSPGAAGYDTHAAPPAHAVDDQAGQRDVTGQWSIPVADGELPDDSGEFSRSSLIEQWGGEAPATLPGGAPAPWAMPEPVAEPVFEAAPQPFADAVAEPAVEPAAEAVAEPVAEVAPAAQEHAPDVEAAVPESYTPEAAVPESYVPEAASGAAPEAEVAGDINGAGATVVPDEVAADGDADADTGTATDGPASPAAPEAAGTAVAPDAPPDVPGALNDEHPLASYVLRVNGADRPVTDAWIGESLLYVLRERLGLAGAKDGCSQGECGACAVQVDGRLVASCLVPAATTAGSEVRTVEGLATDGRPSDVQRALACGSAVQCGFCIPGMAMTVHDLLEGNPAPSEQVTRQALCGNLCRCSGYRGVLDAVREVVAERQAAAQADAAADERPGTAPGDATEGGPDERARTPDATARIPHQAPPGAGGVQPQHPAPQDPAYEPPYDSRYEAPQDGGAA